MATDEVNVLLIGGVGRSGSTLLLRVLGAQDGYLPIGELNNSLEHNFLENRLCGCGSPFRECDFWRAVMDEAFGGMERVDVQRLLSLRESTQRGTKSILYLVYPNLRPEWFQQHLHEYAGAFASIYRAIHKVSNCSVIVDSSKSPRYALAIADTDAVRPKMIHLVRDSRAVAHSWTRKEKRRKDVLDTIEYMPQRGHRSIAINWNLEETLVPIAARRSAASTVCRYEDFAAEPRRTTMNILAELGMDTHVVSQFVTDHQVCLMDDHSVGGNPSRFDHGVISIQPDVAWRREMSRAKQFEVSLLTLPWLLKYGYVPNGGGKTP